MIAQEMQAERFRSGIPIRWNAQLGFSVAENGCFRKPQTFHYWLLCKVVNEAEKYWDGSRDEPNNGPSGSFRRTLFGEPFLG